MYFLIQKSYFRAHRYFQGPEVRNREPSLSEQGTPGVNLAASTVRKGVTSLLEDSDGTGDRGTENVDTPAMRIPVSDLAADKIPKEVDGKYPAHILFEGESIPNASILATSTLGDGTIIYTVRFGISDKDSQSYDLPPYSGLCIISRTPDGVLHINKPIAEYNPDKNIIGENTELFHGQLRTIGGRIAHKLSSDFYDQAQDYILMMKDGHTYIHDISDPKTPDQFKYIFSRRIEGQNIQCQATITYDKNGVPEVYIGGLINEDSKGMTAFIAWILTEGRTMVNSTLTGKGKNKIKFSDIARYERNDAKGRKEIKKPVSDMIFFFEGLSQRESR